MGDDQLFDPCDGEVRQVALVILATAADVVEVLFAGLTATWPDDQTLATATAPQQALEVVIVGAVSRACSTFSEQH
nr:hypothetical protein [Nocardioides faecalis]